MKILHITGRADVGGIVSLIDTYMRHVDQDKYHFDLALTGDNPGFMGKQMIARGVTIHRLPLKSRDIREFERQLDSLLKSEHYDVVHEHSNDTSWVALRVAKHSGIRCRVAHSHLANMPTSKKGLVKLKAGRILNYVYATNLIACGEQAGNVIFGKHFMRSRKAMVLHNAIETERFRFDSQTRDEIRNKLNIDGSYAIGMVGRVSYAKNHQFALEVLTGLRRRGDDVVLLVVGDGELLPSVQQRAHQLGVSECVRFVGNRRDVERYYCALDACIMPSLYEGYPVTAIEALASGLPLFLSDLVTPELGFSDLVTYLPLERSAWVDHIAKHTVNEGRKSAYLSISSAGFDVEENAPKLMCIYDRAQTSRKP